ncbi:hypothetical protein FOZ61_009645 [Perkinsus olseni]|uniref:Uncharacterized protein n=1 Tax=Perkinsus olseni TaxID=32597 RepID=A0A7J6M5R2_PEROL|nr:hypothetical protein FOZ61_009645 [Perkinsus olseni]
MLGPEKSPTDHLSDIMLSDDASFSTDESPPHTAHLSRRHLPPVAKKYYTPTSLQTTSSSPASADQSAVNHDVPPKDRKKKPQALDLAINTDIDDNEVDARFVNAIRSRRLNLSEPVFGTLEYYRMQLRAHATPIYWKDYDPLPEPAMSQDMMPRCRCFVRSGTNPSAKETCSIMLTAPGSASLGSSIEQAVRTRREGLQQRATSREAYDLLWERPFMPHSLYSRVWSRQSHRRIGDERLEKYGREQPSQGDGLPFTQSRAVPQLSAALLNTMFQRRRGLLHATPSC